MSHRRGEEELRQRPHRAQFGTITTSLHHCRAPLTRTSHPTGSAARARAFRARSRRLYDRLALAPVGDRPVASRDLRFRARGSRAPSPRRPPDRRGRSNARDVGLELVAEWSGIASSLADNSRGLASERPPCIHADDVAVGIALIERDADADRARHRHVRRADQADESSCVRAAAMRARSAWAGASPARVDRVLIDVGVVEVSDFLLVRAGRAAAVRPLEDRLQICL